MGWFKKPKFFKDYKVPLYGTAIFVIVVCGMLLARYGEFNTLQNFADKNELIRETDGQLSLLDDYFLNTDPNNQTNYGNSATETPSDTEQNDNTTTSTNKKSGSSSSTGDSGGEDTSSEQPGSTTGNDTPTSGSGGGTVNDPDPGQFEAKVIEVLLAYSQLAPGSKPDRCHGHYEFKGKIEVIDGPGPVEYFWRHGRGTLTLFEGDRGHIDAQPGRNTYYATPHFWDVMDSPSFTGWVQLVVNQPGIHSKKINFEHKCG